MRCKHCQTNCLLFMTTFKKRIDKKQQILILWVNLYIEIYNTLYKIRSLVKLLKYNEYYQNFTYNIKLLTRTVQFTPASYKYKFFWFKSNISTFQCNETRFFFSEQILHSISEVTWHISRYNMAHGAAPNSLHLFHSVQNMASCHKMYSGYKKVLEVACLKKKNKKNLENIVEKKTYCIPRCTKRELKGFSRKFQERKIYSRARVLIFLC